MENSGLLAGGLGIICLGFMAGAGNLDTLLVDFSMLNQEAIRFIQLGFLSIAVYFFLEV